MSDNQQIIDVTPELEIIYKQIQIIREASDMRPISLEETRIFEILVKCKKLIEDKKDESLEAEFKKLKDIKTISASQLMKALEQKTQEPPNESDEFTIK